MSLKAGKEALLRKRYTESIALLLEYCDGHPNRKAKDYIQAQMLLVSAYQRSGRADKAIDICESIGKSSNPELQAWATKSLVTLQQKLAEAPAEPARDHETKSVVKSQANRYRKRNVTLTIEPRRKLMFALAMLFTVLANIGMVFLIFLWIASLNTLEVNSAWLTAVNIATGFASILLFFMSPWLIETVQKQIYTTQWVTLADLDEKCPEAVEIIEEFCTNRNLDIPRLGWIEDDHPVAFTYGILPNSARIVVSRGLFTNLDRDEIAAVYAHQLGQIANYSFSVITFASILPQLIYLLHVNLSRLSFQATRGKSVLKFLASAALVVHHSIEYIQFSISRTSSDLSDHYAAQVTGNPNAMSRALTKMARGILRQTQLGQSPGRILESTRALGTCDYKTTTTVGIAFEVLYAGQTDKNAYKVFLWELANPWADLLEFRSTHSLLGRRIRSLTTYSQQLGLAVEYEFTKLLNEAKTLSKKKLYTNLSRDLSIETAPYVGVILGYFLSNFVLFWLYNYWLTLSLCTLGLGIGLMFQGSLRYPNYRKVADTDLVSLLNDPYASTLKGMPVQVPGELLGYAEAKGHLGYDLKLEDQGGMIYLNYLPNLKMLYSDQKSIVKQMEVLMGESVVVTGWYRRGALPVIDLSNLQPILLDKLADKKGGIKSLNSYHQLWNNIVSSSIVLAGLSLLALTTLS